jgi:hypothetical protein
MEKLKYKISGNTVEAGEGSTESALVAFDFFKERMGKITNVTCAESDTGSHLIVKGSKRDLDLTGCNCGYGGQGPRGTMTVLMKLGVPAKEAEELIFKQSFSRPVSYEGKYADRDLKCPIPTLDKKDLRKIANKVLDDWESKEGKLPTLPMTTEAQSHWIFIGEREIKTVRDKYYKGVADQENERRGFPPRGEFGFGPGGGIKKMSPAVLKSEIEDMEDGWNAGSCHLQAARFQETASCLNNGTLKSECPNIDPKKITPPSINEVDALAIESVFTQETLKRMCNSDKKCKIYRGWAGELKDGKIPVRPLSAWTFEKNWANSVACRGGLGGYDKDKACLSGHVVEKDVPIDDIMAFSLAAGVNNAEMEAIVYSKAAKMSVDKIEKVK